MTADRPDFDDIRLTSDDDTDLEHIDDLDQNLIEDDFEDPAPRPKSRKSLSLMTLVLLLVLVVVGGAFVLLNNETISRTLMAPQTQPAAVPYPAASTPSSPDVDPVAAALTTPVLPPSVPVPSPEIASVTPVSSGSSVSNFADLPQPTAAINDSAVSVVGPVPDASEAVPVVPIDPKTLANTEVTVTQKDIPAEAKATVDVAVNSDVSGVAPVPSSAETSPPVHPVVDVKTPQEVSVPAVAIEQKPAAAVTISEPKAKPQNKGVAKTVAPGEMGQPAEKMKPQADHYYESTDPVQKLADETQPKLVIPDDQLDRDLGIHVGRIQGEDPEGAIAAANRALDLARYDTALEMFNDLYKRNKRDERILMGWALALQKLGRSDEAIRAYDELLALNPNNPDVATNMLGLVQQQNPNGALRHLLDLRARYPQNATVAAQTGLANASVGNLEEALRYLSIAASLEPENAKHYYNMGIISEKMGKPDAAIAAYEKALTTDAASDEDVNRIDRDVVYDRLSVLRQR